MNLSFKHMGLFFVLLLFPLRGLAQQPENMNTVFPVPINDYLTNPGMGWQHAPGIGDPLLPESVSYINRGLIPWPVLNPEPGVYNWQVIDENIDLAVSEGKMISFRIYTMQGEDFGGHQVPQWVIDAGAVITPIGEPDYANCVYQEEWGNFVNAFGARYDGDVNIAFLDISGYGNFNEWGWNDQTEWDDGWGDVYYEEESEPTPDLFTTLDGQARRRLADMFLGGSFQGHECRTAAGEVTALDYDYEGIQISQLVMPYAGIVQSSQYVFWQRSNIGFRYDCLGRTESDLTIIDQFGDELEDIWQYAPVVYEICGYLDPGFWTPADNLVRASHASIVHDNLKDPADRDPVAVEQLMHNVGYRYFLKEAVFSAQVAPGGTFEITMNWHNIGYAPGYEKMGQEFTLTLYFTDMAGGEIAQIPLEVEPHISEWMPADPVDSEPPDNVQTFAIEMLPDMNPGNYLVKVAIIDDRTGTPLNLAFEGRDSAGHYPLGTFSVTE